MKFDQPIEKVHFLFPSKYDLSKEVKVFKNPSFLEKENLKRDAINSEIRGLLVGNVVYIWDADLAIHDEVNELLHEPGERIKFIIDANNNLISADPIVQEDKILKKPLIKRMMKIP